MKDQQREYLSSSILEKEFTWAFSPIFALQKFLWCNRIDVSDGFASPPTKTNRCITAMIAITAMSLDFYYANEYMKRFKDYLVVNCIAVCFGTTKIVVLFANLIRVRFCDSSDAIQLFVKLQKTDRLMGIHHNKKILSIIHNRFMRSWGIIVLVIVAIATSIITQQEYYITLSLISTCWFHIIFWYEIVFCAELMYFLTLKLRYTNAIVSLNVKPRMNMKHWPSELEWSERFRFSLPMSSAEQLVIEDGRDMMNCDTDMYLKEILKGFMMHRGVFRFTILLQILSSTLGMLFSCALLINSVQINVILPFDMVTLFAIVLQDIITVVVLSIIIEMFLREVKRTKRLATAVLAVHLDGPLRAKAKKMIKYIEEAPPKFSVYGIWNMDARLILTLFNVMTTYLITVFQFALL